MSEPPSILHGRLGYYVVCVGCLFVSVTGSCAGSGWLAGLPMFVIVMAAFVWARSGDI